MIFLEELLRKIAPEVSRIPMKDDRFNLLASKGSGKPVLCLNAHSDTVPPSGRSVPKSTCDDNLVRGLGSCDDKASLVSMLDAFSRVDEQGVSGRLDLLISVDEEVSSRGVRTCIQKGYDCDLAVVGEPTGLSPVVAHSGLIFLILETTGTGGHGSSPWKGRNAITRMVDYYRDIDEYVSGFKDHPFVGKPSTNLGVIKGGDTTNRIPDHCRAKVDVRVMPGTSVQEALTSICPLAEKWGALEVFKSGEPMETKHDSSLLDSVLRAEKNVLGMAMDPIGFRGWTEADPFRNDAGADALVLGPGEVSQAHSPDEFVDLAQVKQASEIYLDVATQLLR